MNKRGQPQTKIESGKPYRLIDTKKRCAILKKYYQPTIMLKKSYFFKGIEIKLQMLKFMTVKIQRIRWGIPVKVFAFLTETRNI